MKRVKLFILSFLFAILLSMYIMPVYAEQNGFEYEPLSEEEKTRFLKNHSFNLIDFIPERSIECFDVNEDGLIALGFSESSFADAMIGIYSSDGEFIRGYSFSTVGSFDVGFYGDSVEVYFVRGNTVARIDLDGKVSGAFKITDTLENDKYWRYISSPRRMIGDKRYYLRNDMGILNLVATSYSQLVVVDKNGQSTILYDVNSQQFEKTLIIVSLIIIGMIAIICLLVYRCIQIHNKWKQTYA